MVAQVSQSIAIAQAWMTDTAQEVFNDAVLLRFGVTVYRDIQRFLAQNGDPQLKNYVQFVLGAGSIGAILGTDVIKPIKLWERATGGSGLVGFVEVEEAYPWLIPRAQTNVLSHWEWKNNNLMFIGSTTSREIRMHYSQFLPDLTDVNSPILITDGADALAMGMVAAAAMSHGSPLFATAQAAYERTLNQLVDRNESPPRVRRAPKWWDRARMKPGEEVPAQ